MQPVTIDIVSDVICPWCYLGKARLEKALELVAGQAEVVTVWRPYQLYPEIVDDGVDYHERLAVKLGGNENVERAHDQITELGKELGLSYDFAAIKRTPNTLDAHRVMHWALASGPETQNKLADLLFKANFEGGRFLGDKAVLIELATEAGMEREVVETLLDSDADKEAVLAEINTARQMGVSGVPTFILNQKYAISGAQMPETLAGAILSVASEGEAAPES